MYWKHIVDELEMTDNNNFYGGKLQRRPKAIVQ